MKTSTINKKEIEKFSKIAEEWWNPNGKFKPLHKFNPIRIAYIKDNIIKTFKNLGGFFMNENMGKIKKFEKSAKTEKKIFFLKILKILTKRLGQKLLRIGA